MAVSMPLSVEDGSEWGNFFVKGRFFFSFQKVFLKSPFFPVDMLSDVHRTLSIGEKCMF